MLPAASPRASALCAIGSFYPALSGLQVTARMTTTTVIFARPFCLAGIDGLHPPGRYDVETDEELPQNLSFPAYRRVETRIHLPWRIMGIDAIQTVTIDPRELDEALVRDAAG